MANFLIGLEVDVRSSKLASVVTDWKSVLRCPAIEHLGRLLRAVAEGGVYGVAAQR
jgi:hypothetical protein